jgi:chemosensory pili system protein ChpA (sensor histidine kinase/response regulator)
VPANLPTDADRQRALVRVQARALDTLINDAGEVGATRARLDSELLALRSYLGELNDNVARLRMQLREIEIQAETQMASRIADAQHNQEFDPLEFDRFTRFQELTRMMAESVNDVATVEQNLQRGFDRASGDLAAQARLTRGLQRGLMQARMVQFDALAERLYRVARQSATETGKEVRLLIKGGTVEIDRSVLDRMAGPIEHLIRNAVVHGIEPADARRAAGKSATGALTLEVQQEGNEVVLTFFDDGGGLDLARIRQRAVARHLLAHDEDANDARLTEMIFAPGFSTADAVSELAGRGVGMDVVRSETVALGGRITLSTEVGRGTSFTVHLPLTTAITQVLLVSLGGRLYAIPSGMIDQVHQLREKPLLDAYNARRFGPAGADAPFYYFGALLEETAPMASGRKYSPVVVVRSGAERVAVHVDEVIGNREVVVKHIGPHLARLEGIAGATTLGDGEIVLIYNPWCWHSGGCASVAAWRRPRRRTCRRRRRWARWPSLRKWRSGAGGGSDHAADRDGGGRLADRAQGQPAAADACRLPGGAGPRRRGRAASAAGSDAGCDARRHRDAEHGRFRPDAQCSRRQPHEPDAAGDDHVAHCGEAPSLCGGDRRERVPGQAVQRGRIAAHAAAADRRKAAGAAGSVAQMLGES